MQIFAGYSHPDQTSHAWGTDDAYISYRYAKNLVRGNGLVFNPGERVEGYSNFLYTLLMSGGVMVADKDVYIFSALLNICFITIAFLIFHRYVQSRLGDTQATIAVWLFALCPPVWVWVASGMETPLVILLQLIIWITVEQITEEQKFSGLLLLGLAMILSILTRADGFILPGIAIGYLLLKGKNRAALYAGITITITITVYFLWRYNYYGHLLPNTYYAKVSGPLLTRFKDAARQLKNLALFQGLLVYLLAFLLVLGRIIKNRLGGTAPLLRELRFETFFALGWLLYWFYIGGDFFQERFLVILFPLGIFALLKSIGATLQKKSLSLLVVLLAIFQLSPLVTDLRCDYSFTKYDRWITLGNFLGKNYAGKTLAIDAAGKVPFFSELRTIDMLGLNDEFIAHQNVSWFNVGHNKFDPDYVLAKHPDLIAAWVEDGKGMDLAFGLKRQKYEKAGYRLKYLVNSRQNRPARPNIIDVSNLKEDVISRLVHRQYDYAVLEKIASPP